MTYVLGGYQTDFARNLRREELTLDDLVEEIVRDTLDSAAIDVTQIESIHVGNAFACSSTPASRCAGRPTATRSTASAEHRP